MKPACVSISQLLPKSHTTAKTHSSFPTFARSQGLSSAISILFIARIYSKRSRKHLRLPLPSPRDNAMTYLSIAYSLNLGNDPLTSLSEMTQIGEAWGNGTRHFDGRSW